jgi:DNA-binding NtrC family response regulator
VTLPKLLVLDDDTSWLEQVPLVLEDECLVDAYSTIDQGMHAIQAGFYDIVLLDLNFVGEERTGLDLFRKIHSLDRGVDVIVISGETNHMRLIELFNAGVSQFIAKPARPDDIREAVRRTLEQRQIRQRALELNQTGNKGPKLLGKSLAIQQLRADIARVTTQGVKDVLLTGDTGTGKEVVARLLAGQSERPEAFITVLCSSISDALAESELFGHVRGAFTGAERERIGAFEAAKGGFIFLDEIGEMPMNQQAKLLRVLQERRIQRVGSHQEIEVKFRSIAATHVNLEQAISEKKFREDLYYRIAREVIRVPSLRERIEDIPELVYCVLAGQPASRRRTITNEAMALLQAYAWPGNVRQLIAVVESLAGRCEDGVIRDKDVCRALPEVATIMSSRITKAMVGRYGVSLIAGERRRFEKAIVEASGDRNRAAQILGLSRATYFRKAKELGLVKVRRGSTEVRF